MPRKLRLEYEGAIYHAMNRGDRQEPVFLDDEDRRSYLETLGETCRKTDWQIHAYCLMSNHFHLVVETPRANLVAGMRWFLKELLGKAGWTEKELKRVRKGDPRKARMAARLRSETPMTWSWIAKQLEMGHWRTAANAVQLAVSKRRK